MSTNSAVEKHLDSPITPSSMADARHDPASAASPEVALALSQAGSLQRLCCLGPRPALFSCLQRLGCPMETLNTRTKDWRVARIQLGNEFCERLMLTPSELSRALATIEHLKVSLTLVTPMLTDAGVNRLDKLLPALPAGCEVVVNDWGTLQRLRGDYPQLRPVLGRMLNKMIKDPRLPSEQWTRLHPHNGQSRHFQALLARFGITHQEMDVPPFARAEQFQTAPLSLSVHLPYGYTVKGRMCRIGSLGQPDSKKFLAAHACQKECLTYCVRAERPAAGSETELYSFQRGNTQFYRHSTSMASAMWTALAQGWIERMVFAGDWHENHRPAE